MRNLVDRMRALLGEAVTEAAKKGAEAAAYCQECGHKFKTLAAAEKAAFGEKGCPKCGGSDIDVSPPKKSESRLGEAKPSASELGEIEAILKKHGYNPEDAGKLAKDGMGPEEVLHRIKSTKSGEKGSLEYTHGLKMVWEK
jgi:predicted  nucleic acid-binding Zn-ribbon protein